MVDAASQDAEPSRDHRSRSQSRIPHDQLKKCRITRRNVSTVLHASDSLPTRQQSLSRRHAGHLKRLGYAVAVPSAGRGKQGKEGKEAKEGSLS
jgi:hypothetical protein